MPTQSHTQMHAHTITHTQTHAHAITHKKHMHTQSHTYLSHSLREYLALSIFLPLLTESYSLYRLPSYANYHSYSCIFFILNHILQYSFSLSLSFTFFFPFIFTLTHSLILVLNLPFSNPVSLIFSLFSIFIFGFLYCLLSLDKLSHLSLLLSRSLARSCIWIIWAIRVCCQQGFSSNEVLIFAFLFNWLQNLEQCFSNGSRTF